MAIASLHKLLVQNRMSRVRRYSSHLATCLRLSPVVRDALANGAPVVALESTIISHGMPYPQNVETAQQVEQIVKENGATPATIALIDGKIHVGLGDAELEQLGKSGSSAIKTSRRDMAAVLSQRLLGATTVSGTMVAAHMAGIQVFATGGIGGVHRGAELTMDVSADLTELGRTPVAVVCAGAKSILDLPKTLEFLETQGVPVVAYGKSRQFPAFFSPDSGLLAPWAMQTPEQVARLIKTNAELGLMTGQVIAVPIPNEYAERSAEIERAIGVAVRESEEQGIKGKECTPFLLQRIVELTGVGGAAIDVTSQIGATQATEGLSATSYPGTVLTSIGGVGQNIARAAHYLGAPTYLVSAIGNDAHGHSIKLDLARIGMNPAYLQFQADGARTAVYNALHQPNGDLLVAVADMDINGMLSEQQISEAFDGLEPGVVGLDGNISTLALSTAIMLAASKKACVVFEPTSVPKCASVLFALSSIGRSGAASSVNGLVQIITPNALELQEMAKVALELELVEGVPPVSMVSEIADGHYQLSVDTVRAALTLFPLFPIQLIKLGEKGVVVVSPLLRDQRRPVFRHISPLKPGSIVNSNGAGDSLVGAMLALLHSKQVTVSSAGHVDLLPEEIDDMALRAQRASILSLESPLAISDKLTPRVILDD
ncbi:hypothetical protein GGH94_003545 [Coemansia aciculifera]|uniref:Carbohydrate kinase PfkB domain-containing protein n=1 Tax=Coemansia aciculifera TaxID=417176 RepID=A0A9W8IQ77_9FUNG|nr:hypothetical protein GGH94_003545 [Coemansia aciculifera]